MVLETVGLIGGFITAVALTPQIIKTLKTKSVEDISVMWTLIFMAGLLLWVVYGFMNGILPLMIFSSVEFLMAATLFVLKMIYR
jgi:MtN3 and saliva related transmembrane protein